MKDDYTKVQISKQDITNSKELPGAKLTILDKDGKEVESWVSEDKPHYIERLPVGEYTLREVTAPDGYEVAEDVKFKVEATGEIQHVVMKDSPVKKTDKPITHTKPIIHNTPKTGDDSRPLIWALIAMLSLLAAGGSYALARRYKKH